MFRIAAFLLMASWLVPAQLPPSSWKTDLSKKSIDLKELKSGGPPKGGIPAIDRPRFVSAGEAAPWLNPKEPVLTVEMSGEVRGYPLQILMWHELVNDRIGETPILVSYCPLCNSALVFDRRVDGKTYDFGVSGLLRHSDLVMYDGQTDSLWQQITGEAIVGTLTGKKLGILPSQTVSFATFSSNFPAGKVLSRETGYDKPYGQNPYVGYEFGGRLMMPVTPRRQTRLKPLERIVTVEVGNKRKAYPLSYLRDRRVLEDKIKQSRFVVLFEEGTVTTLDRGRIADSRDVGSVGVFHVEIDGKPLSFRKNGEKVVDRETGSTWNVLGIASGGPLAGKRLKPLDHGVYFAFAWLVFRPDTEIVGEIAAPIEAPDSGLGSRRPPEPSLEPRQP